MCFTYLHHRIYTCNEYSIFTLIRSRPDELYLEDIDEGKLFGKDRGYIYY